MFWTQWARPGGGFIPTFIMHCVCRFTINSSWRAWIAWNENGCVEWCAMVCQRCNKDMRFRWETKQGATTFEVISFWVLGVSSHHVTWSVLYFDGRYKRRPIAGAFSSLLLVFYQTEFCGGVATGEAVDSTGEWVHSKGTERGWFRVSRNHLLRMLFCGFEQFIIVYSKHFCSRLNLIMNRFVNVE